MLFVNLTNNFEIRDSFVIFLVSIDPSYKGLWIYTLNKEFNVYLIIAARNLVSLEFGLVLFCNALI